MKRKQQPRGQRDNCLNCESQQRGGVGHIKDHCSYKGGPHEGRFKEAAAVRRASKKTKRARSDQPAACLKLTNQVQIFFSEHVETTDELEQAKQDPFEFVVKQLSALEERQSDESLDHNRRIRSLEDANTAQRVTIAHLEEANRRLTQSFRATNDIVHGMRQMAKW